MSNLAILGGEPVRGQAYPAWPVHDERDEAAVLRVVRSGQWGGYPYPGPETTALLQEFLALQGGAHAIACVNGTVTMEVALRAAGLGWGDEVIVPAYSFQATAAAPIAAGCIPILVDIAADTYCIDPDAVAAAITDKTRAIIPVHVGPQMADMDAIMALADAHDLIVIEDCAHAPGARWRGEGAGTIGHFGSFSLQSSKTLTAGEGGILVCRSPDLAQRAASIINCGRSHTPGGGGEAGDDFNMGLNYRLSELHAALARVAVARFPEQSRERQEMAAYFEEALSEIPGVRPTPRDERLTSRSLYRYFFAVDTAVFGLTNAVVSAALAREGIPAWTGYEPMYEDPLFQPQNSRLAVPSAFPERFNLAQMKLPVVDRVSKEEAIWLEEGVFRSGKQGVADAVAALRKVYEERSALVEVSD